MITAKGLTRVAKMKELSDNYLGRGALFSDLNGNQLFAMYSEIKNELGDKQADEFIKMVDDIDCLSASNFLSSLYRLEEDKWNYSPEKIKTQNTTKKAEAFSLTAPANRDDTMSIRNCFHFLIDGKRFWY